jgi:hypothetical protein
VQYEHKVVRLLLSTSVSSYLSFETRLNEESDEGWLLLSVTYDGAGGQILIFRRPRKIDTVRAVFNREEKEE